MPREKSSTRGERPRATTPRTPRSSLELHGCDRLTISPDLLQQLEADTGALPQYLLDSGDRSPRPEPLGQSEFLFANNQDPMVAEKLSDGIRRFVADQQQLEALLGA